MDLQISCINKSDRQNPHERILYVGGINSANGSRWKLSQAQVIGYIERREHTFYTLRAGHRANVIVATNNGNMYIKTEADGIQPNNLLSLPECV